jgi:hypothetical protein
LDRRIAHLFRYAVAIVLLIFSCCVLSSKHLYSVPPQEYTAASLMNHVRTIYGLRLHFLYHFMVRNNMWIVCITSYKMLYFFPMHHVIFVLCSVRLD